MASKIKRLNRESDPPPGVLASPVPQYYDQETEQVEDVEGRKGAPLSMLVDTDGQPISPATAGGQTTTQEKLDTLAGLMGALNATKETNPDAASATLLALLRGLMATGATESTLGSVKTATEALAALIDSGALKTTLYGPNGQPISSSNRLPVDAAVSGTVDVSGDPDRELGKVTLTGHVEDQVVLPRAIRSTTTSWVKLSVPLGYSGCQVLSIPRGVTGQFAEGEGFSLSFRVTSGVPSGSSVYPFFEDMKFDVGRSSSTNHLLIIYPGVVTNHERGTTNRGTVWLNSIVPAHLYVRLSITGTFGEGEGVDSEVVVRWMR